MIVINTWVTNKKVSVWISGMHMSTKVTTWRGVFLFGFIPLLLRTTEVIYRQ